MAYSTIRIWKTTLSKLRLLAALTNRRMVQVLDDLITRELEKVNTNGKR